MSGGFEYYQPRQLSEVLSLLERYQDKARILAGGTDLAVYIKEGIEHPEAVIDIKRCAGLKGLDVSEQGVYIGAQTTFSELVAHPAVRMDYALLWDCAHSVASVGIRNRATLVGNICSAVPSLDAAPALLCHDAVVHTVSASGSRDICIHDWFRAPRQTARQADELVLGVSFPKPAVRFSGIYLKLGRYRGEDLAQAGLGILYTQQREYRLAFCAVGPIPTRARRIEQLIKGKTIDAELLSQARALVAEEVSPITDIRSSREYRLHICEVMLQRGIQAVLERYDGKPIHAATVLGG